MPGFAELHVRREIAAWMDTHGWRPEGPAREIAPTAARGHNLVMALPPAPVHATPALAGALSHAGTDAERPLVLVLAPSAQLEEWGRVALPLAAAAGKRGLVARTPAGAVRRLREQAVELVVTTPGTALALLRRAALKTERVASLVLCWPETLGAEGEEALAPLMQDLPKDTQRIVCTAQPAGIADLVERYARKALTIGAPPLPEVRLHHQDDDEPKKPATPGPLAPVGPVRTVSVAWERRVAAVADLVELLDPATLVVWAADTSRADALGQVVPLDGERFRLVTGDVPQAEVILAFDLPSHERLAQLAHAGEVVLLVPADAEAYVAGIASPRRPLRLPGALEEVLDQAASVRAAIGKALEAQASPERALLMLAPLFERYDAARVAGALLDLWQANAAAAPAALPDIAASARIWVGVGKKDLATPADFVAVLTKEVRVDRAKIGRIELKDTFALIEVPAQEAERIASALNGTSVRRKRIVARVDRGPSAPGDRPARPATRGPAGSGDRPPRPGTGPKAGGFVRKARKPE